MQSSRSAFLGAGLQMFGWPSDPDEQMMQHLIAAADLGLVDPPGQPPRRTDDPTHPAATAAADDDRVVVELRCDAAGDETAPTRARRIWYAQPAPTKAPTARDQFLFEWETLLGSIVDQITDELFGSGYLEHIG